MNNRLVNPITNAVISLPEKGWITRSAKSTVWKVKKVLVFKRPSSWGSDAELGDDVVVVLIYNCAVTVLGKRIEGVYLAESAGELLMIVKKGSLPFFEVYKFCFKKKKWLSVDSLGSHAVFIGTNYMMSVSATGYDEDSYIRGNCIYFSRHLHSETSEETARSYLYIYDMKSKMISQHCRDGKKIECSGCCWLLPSLS
ncbi:hypothetical protein ACET3Z_031548 [Daucus carota]